MHRYLLHLQTAHICPAVKEAGVTYGGGRMFGDEDLDEDYDDDLDDLDVDLDDLDVDINDLDA